MFCVNYTEELALLTPSAIMPCLLFSDGEPHGENRRQQVKKECWAENKLLITNNRMTAKQKSDFGDL
jgi:hypothetical protein